MLQPTEPTMAKPRGGSKLRPKLEPTASDHDSDEEGLGFSDVFTVTTPTERERRPATAVASAPPSPSPPPTGRTAPHTTPLREEEESKREVQGEADARLRSGRSVSASEASSSCWSSSSASSYSASSSGGSEAEDDESDADDQEERRHSPRVLRFHQLQGEILRRERQLKKLLRGREGTAYARMLRSQEEAVNAQLLEAVRIRDVSEEEAASSATHSPSSAADAKDSAVDAASHVRTLRALLLDEGYHALPGALSIVLHCILYLTVYTFFADGLQWLCDTLVIRLTGWHITDNWFSTDSHEVVFYASALLLSLLATRITGVVYGWHEGRRYQQRVAFHWRNKWQLRGWDVGMATFFGGDDVRECHPESEGGRDTRPKRKKVWGPRAKYLLDLCSFFVCYTCVARLVSNGVVLPMSDITRTVLDGLPSRRPHAPGATSTPGARAEAPSAGNGFSHGCARVLSALDNPYAADLLQWIAARDAPSEEAESWIRNAEECGWSGAAGSDAAGAGAGRDAAAAVPAEACAEGDAGAAGAPAAPPPFLAQRRVASAGDAAYLQEAVSREAYWELLGEPVPKFYDAGRERLLLAALTAVCLGVLCHCGIPVMII